MSATEDRRIVALWRRNGAKALVTLVRAEGSSYRMPGAKILIAGATYAGTVSGGCLEAEVVRKTAWITRDGAAVMRYRTGFDEAGELSFGSGCGGTVDLLLEPAGTPEFEALMSALEHAVQGIPTTVVTWLPKPQALQPDSTIYSPDTALRRAVLAEDGTLIFASDSLDPACLTLAAVGQLSAESVFIERLSPPQRLIVVGAGDDAKPVVEMAALLGWRVTVIDGRSHLARAERFPHAEQVVVAEAATESLDIRAEDAVVLMTHSYEQDRAWLTATLPRRPQYFGVLGARHRTSLLVTEAAQLTGLSVEQCCDRIYAPIGLDLGGDGAEAIALAVIAEAQACMTGRIGRSRRLTGQDVAEQVQLGDAARYIDAACAL